MLRQVLLLCCFAALTLLVLSTSVYITTASDSYSPSENRTSEVSDEDRPHVPSGLMVVASAVFGSAAAVLVAAAVCCPRRCRPHQPHQPHQPRP